MLPLEVAMGRIVEAAWAVTAEQRAEVEALLRRRDLAPRVRERLEMVKGLALGQDVGEIAAWSGRSVRRVRHWLGRFRAGGPAALADAPRSGRPVKAGPAYLEALEAAVEAPPPSLGLPFDVWTSDRLSAHLAGATGVRIAPGWLRALLARRDFVCGRPKHTLKHLQDPEEVAACEAALAEAGGKGGGRAGPVRAPLPG
jgi:transposase